MTTTSRSHRSYRDRHALPPRFERPRPSDPGADEDVPSERESDEGREGDDRRAPADEPTHAPRQGLAVVRQPEWTEILAVIGLTVALGLLAPEPRPRAVASALAAVPRNDPPPTALGR